MNNELESVSAHYKWSVRAKQRVSELMKEDAIEFANFIKDKSYTKSEEKGWYKYYTKREDFPAGFCMSTPVYEFSTIEEIYELYLQSKSMVV